MVRVAGLSFGPSHAWLRDGGDIWRGTRPAAKAKARRMHAAMQRYTETLTIEARQILAGGDRCLDD